jgi:hypothetical protein
MNAILWVLSLGGITSAVALNVGVCVSTIVSPQSGLCSGNKFPYKICTGDAPYYRTTRPQLLAQLSTYKTALEEYSWSHCSKKVTDACVSFLPTTSVCNSFLLSSSSICTKLSSILILTFFRHWQRQVAQNQSSGFFVTAGQPRMQLE